MGIPLSTPPSQTPPAHDQASAVVTNAITATATAGLGPFSVYGDFNFAAWGTTAFTVKLQKTFDGGTTYIDAMINAGTVIALTAPGAVQLYESERGVSYIANCTTFGSGTLSLRFSANGNSQSQGWR